MKKEKNKKESMKKKEKKTEKGGAVARAHEHIGVCACDQTQSDIVSNLSC